LHDACRCLPCSPFRCSAAMELRCARGPSHHRAVGSSSSSVRAPCRHHDLEFMYVFNQAARSPSLQPDGAPPVPRIWSLARHLRHRIRGEIRVLRHRPRAARRVQDWRGLGCLRAWRLQRTHHPRRRWQVVHVCHHV
jgi:hypothetical protein